MRLHCFSLWIVLHLRVLCYRSQPPSGSYPQSNSFVARRNTNNTGEAVLTRGNSSSDIFTSFRNVALDQNDNIFIYGSTSDPSGKNFGNGVSVSGKGYFFVKYNSAGTAQSVT